MKEWRLLTELDLSRALMLTYAGVGAAFVVLTSLILYTLLISWLGDFRARRQAARQQSITEMLPPQQQPAPATAAAATAPPEPVEPPNLAPQLAAAIAVAVAQAQEISRRERAESAVDQEQVPLPPADGAGWKEQGRIAAFDTRRLRDRER